jgi:hypothetical protein
MRIVGASVVVIGAASALVACGALFGLAENEPNGTTTPDAEAGSDTPITAEGGSALRECEVIEERFDDLADLPGSLLAKDKRWGNANVEPADGGSSVTLARDQGTNGSSAMLAHQVTPPDGGIARARLKGTFGHFDKLRCEVDLNVAAWVGTASFLSVRIKQPAPAPWEELAIEVGTRLNRLELFYQNDGARTDAGKRPEEFERLNTPLSDGNWHHIVLSIDLDALTATVDADENGRIELMTKLPKPPPFTEMTLAVGVPVAPLGAHDVRVDNLSCHLSCRDP